MEQINARSIFSPATGFKADLNSKKAAAKKAVAKKSAAKNWKKAAK